MPRDPRGPEYGDASRLERIVTTLLVLGAVAGVALVALGLVFDLGGALDGIAPAWVTIPVAILILVVLAVIIGG